MKEKKTSRQADYELLYRQAWLRHEKEEGTEYRLRIEKQTKKVEKLRRGRGECYMVRFGGDDIRPMWESDILVNGLREKIRAVDGLPLDCPLCQPYDNWMGRQYLIENRRYLCRILNPKYENGCINEGGAYSKCACLLKGEKKKELKFKKEERDARVHKA